MLFRDNVPALTPFIKIFMPDSYPYPIARVGVIGGGQLGRMLVMAAHRLGCEVVVLDPYLNSPAGQIAGHQIVGNYHDPARLRELVESSTVTTFEIEDIDTDTLIALEDEGHKIFPSPRLLAEIQDKYRQKQLFARAGIPTSEFIDMPKPDRAAFEAFGYPLVQKTRRGGYDGRGVAVMMNAEDYEKRLNAPSLVERFVPAAKELAVMVARGQDGDVRCYSVVEMEFSSGENILDRLLVPARIDAATTKAAQELAVRTVEALDGVGIFGVEMFLSSDGELLVNEIAPRTHNSGHYTIEACVTNQFEQHLRTITNLPLGATDLLQPAVMLNLLGEPGYTGRPIIQGLAACLKVPGVSVQLYGKAETKPHRKMGHITVSAPTLELANERATAVSQNIKILGDHPL